METVLTTSSPSGDDMGWDGYTVRILVLSGMTATGGNNIRLTLSYLATSYSIENVYIGEKASSGDLYDFAGTPTQITFNTGSGSVSVSGAGQVSDDIEFSFDDNKDYVISLEVVSGNIPRSTGYGAAVYAKLASDASTVNTSGYFQVTSGNVWCLSKIEAETTGTIEGAGEWVMPLATMEATGVPGSRGYANYSLPVSCDSSGYVVAIGDVSMFVGSVFSSTGMVAAFGLAGYSLPNVVIDGGTDGGVGSFSIISVIESSGTSGIVGTGIVTLGKPIYSSTGMSAVVGSADFKTKQPTVYADTFNSAGALFSVAMAGIESSGSTWSVITGDADYSLFSVSFSASGRGESFSDLSFSRGVPSTPSGLTDREAITELAYSR